MEEERSQQEPGLSGLHVPLSGMEPSLGGDKRPKLDRDLFWELLDIDRYGRTKAIEKVLDQGMAKYYASAMISVLQPNARHFQLGRLLKVPYSYEHKLAAIDSLARLKPESALHGLLVAMSNKDLALQQAATYVIGQLEDPEADEVLIDILHDSRPKLRHAALQSISARWQQPQIRYLNHSMGTVAASAARWLGQHEQARVFPILVMAFNSYRGDFDNEAARLGILQAITDLCLRWLDDLSHVTIDFLRHCLESRQSQTLKQEALAALETLGTQEALALYIVYKNQMASAD